MSREQTERTERFGGLSDRDAPAQLTRWESPDLLNVEFYEGFAGKRRGYSRVTTTPFRDCSVRFNGLNEFLRIPNSSSYTSAQARHVGIKVELLEQMRALGFVYHIATKGYGTGSNLEWRIWYGRIGGGTDAGWWFEYYDAVDAGGGAPGLVSLSVVDGTVTAPPTGQPRFIEFNQNFLSVYDEDGNEIGTTAHTLDSTFITSAEPIYLGVDVTAASTVGTFYSTFKWCEFRLGFFPASPAATPPGMTYSVRWHWVTSVAEAKVAANSEWPRWRVFGDLGGTGYGSLVGYWPGNDGTGQFVTDKVSSNHAVPGYAGPVWNTTPSQVLGPSGLRFTGQSGVAVFTAQQADVDSLFVSGGNPSPCTFTFMFRPELAAGETTVRDQTLFKMGSVANPSPIHVRVVSDNLRFDWYDGTSNYNATISTISTWVGKRLGVVADYVVVGSLTPGIALILYDLDGAVGVPVAQAFTTVGSGAPSVRSPQWSFGASLSSFLPPFTGTSVAYGTLDDFRVYTRLLGAPRPQWTQLFSEANPGQPGFGLSLRVYFRFNEGSGHRLTNDGNFSVAGYLYPESQTGIRWCSGMVDPDEPVPIRLIFDYRRFTQGALASSQRRAIVVSGCTVSEVDFSTGAVRVLCGGIHKGGLLTATQYNDSLFIAGQNGQRPFVLRGTNLHQLGIEAPGVGLHTVTTSAGVGTFPAGTYSLYYTYYNSQLGAESNPSPATSVVLLANDRITGFQVPISSDPQVTGRRIYASQAGTPGAAWLIHEEFNNTVTAISGLTINTVSTSALALEFTANGAAPAGSVIQVFSDYLFIGGNQQYPTRLFFSQAGNPYAFRELDYKVLDTDSGDPITAMRPRLEALTVYTRDSRWNVWPTGLSADPINVRQVSATEGAVGPAAVLEIDKDHIVVGERNIYRTDGFENQSLSSPPRTPPGQPSPSIQKTLREKVADAYRAGITAAVHRSKDQIWFAYPKNGSTSNDRILVYDLTRGIWSKYDIPADYLVEIEDGNDSPWIYAGVRGFLCRLDDGDYDGGNFEVFSHTVADTRYGDTSLATVGIVLDQKLKGRKVFVYRLTPDPDVVAELEVVSVSAASNRIYFKNPSFKFEIGDVILVGAINWEVDFVLGTTKNTKEKRMQWLTLSLANMGGDSNTNSMAMRVFAKPNQFLGDADWTTGTQYFYRLFPSTDKTARWQVPVGGSGTSWRVKITHTPIADSAIAHTAQPKQALPSNARWGVVEFTSTWIETDAR